jgi:hypothetical protein
MATAQQIANRRTEAALKKRTGADVAVETRQSKWTERAVVAAIGPGWVVLRGLKNAGTRL